MARVPLSKPKSRIEDAPEGLRITIPSPKNGYVLIFLPIWLCGWFAGELSAIKEVTTQQLYKNPFNNWFMLVWLTGWTAGGITFIFYLIWSLIGKELILLDGSSLKIRHKLGNTIFYSKDYDLDHVINLRVVPQPSNYWGYYTKGQGANPSGTVAFDYSFKTYRFGSGIDEAEAAYLIDEVRKRYPRLTNS